MFGKKQNIGLQINALRHVWVKRRLAPYRRYSAFLEKSQWWSLDELTEYQNKKFKRYLHSAFQYVPFYKDFFKQNKDSIDEIWTTDDMYQLPVVEKEYVQQAPARFVSRHYKKFLLYKCYTSGTSGTPLTLYRNLSNIGFEHAVIMRQYQWAGIHPRERIGILKGDILPSAIANNRKCWLLSKADNRLIMSSYHLSINHTGHYIDALKRYKPVALDGYPSSIYVLARMLENLGMVFPLKAVLTSSETLTPEQRHTIEKIFECKIFDYYGHAERVAAIHTCEHGRYHIIPEYGIVELLPIKDQASNLYELIASGLNNKAMPLFRYRTGDVVTVDKSEACPCGRKYPQVSAIGGRIDDYIVTPEGRLVGRMDHVFKGIDSILQAQIYQPNRQELVLRIIPDEQYEIIDDEYLRQKVEERVGESMNIEIEYVNEIPRGGRGKVKSVVSCVNPYEALEMD